MSKAAGTGSIGLFGDVNQAKRRLWKSLDVYSDSVVTTQQAGVNSLMASPDAKNRLIITTGDTSDVDGFLALAEYSKVLFDSEPYICIYVYMHIIFRLPALHYLLTCWIAVAVGCWRPFRYELPRLCRSVDRRRRIPHQPSWLRVQVHFRTGQFF